MFSWTRLAATMCLALIAGCGEDFVQALDAEPREPRPPQTQANSETYKMGDCLFRIYVPAPSAFEAHGDAGNYYMKHPYVDGGSFRAICLDRSDSQNIADWLGARKVNGEWLKFTDVNGVDESFYFWPEEHAEIVQLRGINWEGIAIVVDDVTGEKSSRNRWFNFCLMHDAQAFCGTASIMTLGFPETNVQAKVITAIKTIEFVDAPVQGN